MIEKPPNVMTYRDIPVLRSAGFECGFSGYSWFGYDKIGRQWVVEEEEDNGYLRFYNHHCTAGSQRFSRDEFSEVFRV